MAFPIQNFRSATPGLQPLSLLVGQFFINTADKILYTGDGSNFKTSYEGVQVPGVPGEGWFATPLTFQGAAGDFIINPEVYGDIPTDGQVLTWDETLNQVIWSDTMAALSVYQFTNAQMVAATGNTASEKLNALTGGCATTGSVAIVSGVPGDEWQGEYSCNGGAWFFGANYAFPTAAQVPYTPSGDLTATDVQAAIDELEVDKVETPSNTPAAGQVLGWNGTATEWVTGGGGGGGSVDSVTGTAPITVDNTDPANPVVGIDAASTLVAGAVQLNDTITSTSVTEAATANAAKTAYDAATSAQTLANSAQATASSAESTANSALTAAGTAQAAANDAQTAADSAAGVAATALGNAAIAQTTAEAASTAAANAQTSAAIASGQAQTAQTTANTAISAADTAQTTANTAISDAASKFPTAGGTFTGSITTQNVNVQAGYSVQFNGGLQGTLDAISDSTTLTSSTAAASATAAKTAKDAADAAQADATAALTKANSDLVAPVAAAVAGDLIEYSGTANIWSSKYDLNALVNTIYCNVGVKDVQVAIDEAVPGTPTQISLAAGKYLVGTYPTNGVVIDACDNLTIAGPSAPESAYSAQIGETNATDYRNLTIQNGSVYFNFKDLAIKGNLYINGTQLRSYFDNVTVVGETFFQGVNTNFIFFQNCNFTDDVTVNSQFAGSVFFVNCTFNNHTVNISTTNPLQVILTNCNGLSALPSSAVATLVGFNALNSGLTVSNAQQYLQSGTDIGALAIGSLPRATYQALGDLVVGGTGGTPTRFPVSPNSGYILTVNPAMPFGIEWAAAAPGGILSVSGVTPVTVNVTDPANPVISVSSASTSALGVVQLNNSTTSTSDTEALTAAQGKILQDQIDALAVTTNLILGGTFNANTGLVDSVTTQGTTAGLSVGSALPTPGPTNNEIFVIVDVQGSTGPSGTPPYHVGDWFLSDGTTWQFLNVGFAPGQATTLSQGVVQLATDAEVQAGTESNNAVVSSALQSKLSDSVTLVSSTTIASSAAVKTANDAGVAGVSAAATAQSTANTAETNAQTGITNAAAAQSTANTALANAGLAQTDATAALSNAATAQSTANTAEANAQTGITNAAAAQSTANTAEANAQTGITNAAAAQATANTAEANAQTGITNAAAAQSTANTALTKANSDLVAPTNTPTSTSYLGYTGSASQWKDINDVTLTSKTFYINTLVDTWPTTVPTSQGVYEISFGEFATGGDVIWDGGNNITFIGPETVIGSPAVIFGDSTGANDRNLTITGATSTRVSLTNLRITGTVTIDGTQGRHKFKNVVFSGGVVFTGATSNFIIFEGCSFGGDLVVPSTFAGTIQITNSNFAGNRILSSAFSPAQVICSNNAGLFSLTQPNITLVGINATASFDVQVLTTNVTTSEIILGASPVVPGATKFPAVIDGVTGSITPTAGATGSFTSSDGKTITVTNGLITSIV